MKIKATPTIPGKSRGFCNWTLVVLAALSMVLSTRAGTITLVNLPPTSTDIATGITTNKYYVSAFDYGNQNTTTYSVNGVPFRHFDPGNQIVDLTNALYTNLLGQVGQVILSCSNSVNHPTSNLARTSNSGQGSLSSQADGNMFSILTDLIYVGNSAPVGSWIKQEFDSLIVGHPYSLRIYYRYWGNAAGDRTQNVYFNGEGINQAYSGNPLDEDAGGAHYIEYDFTATATNVFCTMTNLVANGATMIEAATLEDTSYPLAPFITYQAKASGIGNGIFRFGAAAIGTAPLAYQWYFNTASNYSGAIMATDDGLDYSGSTTTNLTVTNNLLDYYFVVVSNSYGSVTSSIAQVNPNPSIATQPVPTNVANSYIQFSATVGGFLPLTYQWYINTASNYTSGAFALTDGGGVSGSATNSLTTTTNLQDYYFLIVSNSYGTATSTIEAYNPKPVIVTQPVASKAGSSVQFSTTANGWPTLGYQWYFNTASSYSGASMMMDGNGVSGSTTASVTVTNLLDYYFVVVTNYYGSVTSSVVAAAVQLTAYAGQPIWNLTAGTNIVVYFSDVVSNTTATNLSNYLLNNGASIASAKLVASNEVVLGTSALNPAVQYTLLVQNVKNNSFGIPMNPTPTNIVVGLYPAGLALWVKASTNVITDSSGNVTEWDDLSGNGNNFYNAYGPPYEPQLGTNSLGDPVITFTGTNETVMYANPSSSLAITGDLTIIAVVNFADLDGNTNGMVVSKTGGTGFSVPAPYDYYVLSTNSGAHLYRGNGLTYGQVTASSSPSIGTPHILLATEAGNTVSHYLDGIAAGTGVLNNSFNESSSADAGNYLWLGTRQDGVNRLTGDLSELIIAGSAISSYDIAALDNYLVAQHNLVLINLNPTNIVVSVTDNQITLSWPADHTGWLLQSNSVSLTDTGAWVTVPGSAAVNQMTITPDATKTNVFYRMFYQPQ